MQSFMPVTPPAAKEKNPSRARSRNVRPMQSATATTLLAPMLIGLFLAPPTTDPNSRR